MEGLFSSDASSNIIKSTLMEIQAESTLMVKKLEKVSEIQLGMPPPSLHPTLPLVRTIQFYHMIGIDILHLFIIDLLGRFVS